MVWDADLKDANPDAEYDDPKDVFSNSYVEYKETLYGKEEDASMMEWIIKPESQVQPSPSELLIPKKEKANLP